MDVESLIKNLRDEARFRPVYWGQVRNLFTQAAEVIEAQQKVLDSIRQFEEFASHKTGGEFFRYMARAAREENRACVDTQIWDAVANCMEAMEEFKNGR